MVPTDSSSAASRSDDVTLREPSTTDGARMWSFVDEHGGLELNTAYAYMVLAEDFSATSIVADGADGELAGFVLGYRPPKRPEALFVWQVGVAPSHRGQGLARTMILDLVRRNQPDVTHVESTVTPSNAASRRLFTSIAEHLDTECQVTEDLTEALFPGDGHEAEDRFRIGPFSR